ncbi:MAG: EAL domain-containing protein [Hydrogenophilales bacterium]|nr:EAL domain-containing protein [Hydrogenophilales bacterium]
MLFRTRDEKRISLISGAILLILTVAAGLSVYGVMHKQAEAQLSRSLQQNVESRARVVEREIRQHLANAAFVTNRASLQEKLAAIAKRPGDEALARELELSLRSFLPIGFNALAVYDPVGREVARAGPVEIQPELSMPLNLPYRSRLEWDGGLVLATNVEISNAGQLLGKLAAVRRMPEMMGLITDLKNLGESAELHLCAAEDSQYVQCFPTKNSPRIATHLPRMEAEAPTPMSRALAGGSGFITSRDSQGELGAAAYLPVGNIGLGMVLRIDAAELYQPISDQVRYVLPILLLLLAGGALLLRWQVLPLLRQVVVSEERARELNQKLRRNEARIRAVLDRVDEAIISMTSEGVIRTINPAAERMFDYSSEELVGNNISMLMPEPYRSQHDQHLKIYLETGQTTVIGKRREIVGRRRDGITFPLELSVGEVKFAGEHLFIGVMRDIAERKATEARVSHLANHDSLTNLPNRNLLQDRARQSLMQASRHQQRVGIVFIDLDHFKTINDSLGHHVGDRLLQTVAPRIRSCLRDEDTVARQGGDEFIVVLPNIKRFEDIGIVAQKLIVSLSAPYSIDGAELHTSASVGVAVYPDDGPDVETLMRNADTAMYYAKATGRNNFQFFTPQMNQAASERLQIESNLRQALTRNEFTLHFQPIVNLATGQVGAAEALLRWNPGSGPIGPDRFIPVAEETGLIVPIGEWVIRHACRERQKWALLGITQPRMFVNISARQFTQRNLVATVGRMLQEVDLTPEQIGIEITESLLMERPEDAIRTLKNFSDMGVQISVDDFGTGYSSLSYLKRFPLDKLKVDRSFVRDIATDPDDAAIVTAIIAMAHSLNIQVVAEGVETEQQMQFLRSRGCDEYQGYYFSRPVPSEAFIAKLSGIPG